MGVSNRHILSQIPVIQALGKTALSALRQGKAQGGPPVATPGPLIERQVPPLPPQLVRDYIRHVGGDPSAYRGALPPHLFPQWGFPLASQTLVSVPYPLLRVMNGGCRIQVNGPLPSDEPLQVSAHLASIDDDGRRAVLAQRVVTGTAAQPEQVVADLFAIVPLGGKKSSGKQDGGAKNGQAKSDTNGQAKDGASREQPKSKERPRVPSGAREIAYLRLPQDAGLDFAKLTGDFNPIHWVPAYARASGFRGVILHGFSTLARAIEALNRGVFAGRPSALRDIDVRFTRPLVLPAKVGVYVEGQSVFVGDAPGGPAYLAGTFNTGENP
ncbi:MAG: MaoC family dehydratase [Polyangiaceae bacterium]|nr:MaoC family dehydratase [Polyangiaceae bacterium]MCW5792583.1 MaoC family dehydratase [Polyangiaceae bacterium]